MFFHELRFAGQVKFLFFLRSKQRKHGADSRLTPSRDFIFEPVTTSRTCRHRQPSRPAAFHPIELSRHSSEVSLHHDFARKDVNVDPTSAQNVNAMVPVEYSAIRPSFEAVSLSRC